MEGAPRVLLFLFLNGAVLYLALNVLLILVEYVAIQYFVPGWHIEVREFNLGQDPPWLGSPPRDFLHLPPGSDLKAHFSLMLSITNNPSWLKATVSTLQMSYALGAILDVPLEEDITFHGDRDVPVRFSVPFHRLNEFGHYCLRHFMSTEESLPSQIVIDAKISLFGVTSESCVVRSFVATSFSANNSGTIPLPWRLVKGCEKAYAHLWEIWLSTTPETSHPVWLNPADRSCCLVIS
ncbi:hypothetical protein FOZ60_001964 [Perkinsus olseni]|uniref:Uncharacterized protein n=1 Tax=Perkinsus olseni TaxID=32597 RepID=A0A7J6P097_PEROL|nr:hypothetical protein FOZ60_001964 [Perkinsus olseni]